MAAPQRLSESARALDQLLTDLLEIAAETGQRDLIQSSFLRALILDKVALTYAWYWTDDEVKEVLEELGPADPDLIAHTYKRYGSDSPREQAYALLSHALAAELGAATTSQAFECQLIDAIRDPMSYRSFPTPGY